MAKNEIAGGYPRLAVYRARRDKTPKHTEIHTRRKSMYKRRESDQRCAVASDTDPRAALSAFCSHQNKHVSKVQETKTQQKNDRMETLRRRTRTRRKPFMSPITIMTATHATGGAFERQKARKKASARYGIQKSHGSEWLPDSNMVVTCCRSRAKK